MKKLIKNGLIIVGGYTLFNVAFLLGKGHILGVMKKYEIGPEEMYKDFKWYNKINKGKLDMTKINSYIITKMSDLTQWSEKA